ncbi:MAG: hypothetical protein LC797_18030 [Chloroflexi bacterium]|nr:hypothetical protein [Chloroflexota bacterium]
MSLERRLLRLEEFNDPSGRVARQASEQLDADIEAQLAKMDPLRALECLEVVKAEFGLR